MLLISDSHGHDMATILHEVQPGCAVMVVQVGRNISAIRLMYSAKLRGILSFKPEVIVVHLGHNDIVAHPVHNPSPRHLKYFVPVLLDFCETIQMDHPAARLMISNLFPRTVGPRFTESMRKGYNRLAY